MLIISMAAIIGCVQQLPLCLTCSPLKVSASGLLPVWLTSNSVHVCDSSSRITSFGGDQLSSHPAEPHQAGGGCLTLLNMEQSLLSGTARFLLGVRSSPRSSWQLVWKRRPATRRAATRPGACFPQTCREAGVS